MQRDECSQRTSRGATLEEVIFLRQLKKVDKQLAVFDEEGSGITAAELDDAVIETSPNGWRPREKSAWLIA